jgi:hypothetical protein
MNIESERKFSELDIVYTVQHYDNIELTSPTFIAQKYN